MTHLIRHLLWQTALGVMLGAALGGAAGAQTHDYAGDYQGISSATGMSLKLVQVGQTVLGRLVDAKGTTFMINGRLTDDTVQGSLYTEEGATLFRAEPRALGLHLVVIPLGEGNKPTYEAAEQFSFARISPVKPEVPEGAPKTPPEEAP